MLSCLQETERNSEAAMEAAPVKTVAPFVLAAILHPATDDRRIVFEAQADLAPDAGSSLSSP